MLLPLGHWLYFCWAGKVKVAKVAEPVVIAGMQKRVEVESLEGATVVGEVEAKVKTIGLFIVLGNDCAINKIGCKELTSASMLPNGGPPLSMGWSAGCGGCTGCCGPPFCP